MEQISHDEGEESVAQFQCQNIQNETEKCQISGQRPEIDGIKNLEANILSLTPEKTNEPLYFKCKKEGAELPEKYKILSELFDGMTSSLRLLSLCKRAPTFGSVCTQVEVLRRRKFSHRHLAQIKYILPEAVQTEKILIHDEKTLRMEPDMQITLLFDVIEGHYEQSAYTALQHIFSSRLFSFISKHPEGCEVPEAELPEPFNKKSSIIATGILATDQSTESPTNMVEAELLNSSHLHPSFGRHFSTKGVDVDLQKSQLLASPIPLSSARNDSMSNQDTGSELQEPTDSCMDLFLPRETVQVTCPIRVSSMAHESTPVKLALETENIVVETPAQATPKRSVPSDNKPKSVTSQKWMSSNISTKRSLDFSNLEGDARLLDSSADDAEQCEDVKSFVPGETKIEESSWCTSKDAITNRDEVISHQQKHVSLSDLVAIIHRIFQSACFYAITRQELVHKILVNNIDVVESREIEDQLELLEKLVPDWISKDVAPTGDLLYKNLMKSSGLQRVLNIGHQISTFETLDPEMQSGEKVGYQESTRFEIGLQKSKLSIEMLKTIGDHVPILVIEGGRRILMVSDRLLDSNDIGKLCK